MQAVWCELVSGSRSLICWESTGNLSGARLPGWAIRPNAASLRGHTGMFPEFGNREIRGNEHGLSWRESNSHTGGPDDFGATTSIVALPTPLATKCQEAKKVSNINADEY